MASSNRHWPSLFKSKPCNTHHHQWHHDLISNACNRPVPGGGGGGEERSPEPKPRWNPKPEQIRILEAIFNSGMVNPPRDEIRKIRAQLQEYGQVGDANVFYWFQNRKSRSKNKQRHLHNKHPPLPPPPVTSSSPPVTSSSSKNNNVAVSQNCYGTDFMDNNYGQQQGFCFSELSNVVQAAPAGPCTSLLLSEVVGDGGGKKDLGVGEKIVKGPPQMMSCYSMVSSSSALTASPSSAVSVPSTINLVQGVGESCGPRSMMVFINDVPFEVGVGPFNVREAFGDDVVLINSCGQPVLTNEWGVTVHSLQHGAFYYLI